MNKFYWIVLSTMTFCIAPSYAQTTKKGDKKNVTPTPPANSGYTTVYVIDGVRPSSQFEFFKLKSEDIYSINTLTDSVSTKKYAQKGESLKAVILVQTVKKKPAAETVVSDKTTTATPPKN